MAKEGRTKSGFVSVEAALEAVRNHAEPGDVEIRKVIIDIQQNGNLAYKMHQRDDEFGIRGVTKV